jgi:hypothetical protein
MASEALLHRDLLVVFRSGRELDMAMFDFTKMSHGRSIVHTA